MTASCRYRCGDIARPAGDASVEAPRYQPAPQTVRLDQTGQGHREFCSWHQTEWRSLLVREFISAPVVEDGSVVALPDQLLVLVLSGSKTIESRHGSQWRRSRFTPGRLSMTMPGRPTLVRWRCDSAEPQRSLHVHLPGQLLEDTAIQLWGVDHVRYRMPDALSVSDPILEQVLRGLHYTSRAGVDDLYAQSAAAYLAAHLLSAHSGLGELPRLRQGGAAVTRAQQFIRDNVQTSITLADIAASANLSAFHFLRVFKAATGETPGRYLTRIRLEAAMQLLATTNFPVREIAARCGFRSASSLTAAFRAYQGGTPTQFRLVAHRR